MAYFLWMGSTKHTILQTLTRQTDKMSQWYCLMPIGRTDIKLSDFPLLYHSCGETNPTKTPNQHTFLLTVEFITKYLSSLMLKKSQIWDTTVNISSDKHKLPKTETNETKVPKQWNSWVKKKNAIAFSIILASLCLQLKTSTIVWRVNRLFNSWVNLTTKLPKRKNYLTITKHISIVKVHIYKTARRSLDSCHHFSSKSF